MAPHEKHCGHPTAVGGCPACSLKTLRTMRNADREVGNEADKLQFELNRLLKQLEDSRKTKTEDYERLKIERDEAMATANEMEQRCIQWTTRINATRAQVTELATLEDPDVWEKQVAAHREKAQRLLSDGGLRIGRAQFVSEEEASAPSNNVDEIAKLFSSLTLDDPPTQSRPVDRTTIPALADHLLTMPQGLQVVANLAKRAKSDWDPSRAVCTTESAKMAVGDTWQEDMLGPPGGPPAERTLRSELEMRQHQDPKYGKDVSITDAEGAGVLPRYRRYAGLLTGYFGANAIVDETSGSNRIWDDSESESESRSEDKDVGTQYKPNDDLEPAMPSGTFAGFGEFMLQLEKAHGNSDNLKSKVLEPWAEKRRFRLKAVDAALTKAEENLKQQNREVPLVLPHVNKRAGTPERYWPWEFCEESHDNKQAPKFKEDHA